MPVICAGIVEEHRRIAEQERGKDPLTSMTFSRLATRVSEGPMYWVADNVTPLIQHIAGSRIHATFRDLLPAPAGVLLWGSAPLVVDASDDNSGGPFETENPIDGVEWFLTDADWLGVTFFSRQSVDAAEHLALLCEQGGRGDLAKKIRARPPMSYGAFATKLDIEAGTMPLSMRPRPWYNEMLRLLAATFVVADSDQIASVGTLDPTAKQLKRTKRASRPPGAVRVVNVKQAPSEGRRAGESDREYQSRWLVSGHMRWQPYGPGSTKRRYQWIAPYVKGPADKPIVAPRPVVHHITAADRTPAHP